MGSHSTVTGIVSTPQTSAGNIVGIGHQPIMIEHKSRVSIL